MSSDETEFTFIRCPGCRSLVPAVATRCRMCGQLLERSSKEESPLDAMAKKSRVRQRTISVQEEGVDEIKSRLARGETLQQAPVEEPEPQPRSPMPVQPEPPEEDFHFRDLAQPQYSRPAVRDDEPEQPVPFPAEEEDFAAEEHNGGPLDFSSRPYAPEPEPVEADAFEHPEEEEGEEDFEDDSEEAAPAEISRGGAPLFDGAAGSPEGKKKRRRRRRRKKKGPAPDAPAAAAAPAGPAGPQHSAGFRIGRGSDEDKVFQLPPKEATTPPPWRSTPAPEPVREARQETRPQPPRYEERRQERHEPRHEMRPAPVQPVERPPHAAEWLEEETISLEPEMETAAEAVEAKAPEQELKPVEVKAPEVKAPELRPEPKPVELKPIEPPPAQKPAEEKPVEAEPVEAKKEEPAPVRPEPPKPEPKKEAPAEKPRSVQQQAGKGALVGWFVTYVGAEKGAATEIRGGRCFISRDKVRPTDLVIGHESISSPHCLLIADPQRGITIEDLLSENGTFVQRSGSSEVIRIEEGESTTLSHGDRVKLGDYEMLVCLVPR